MALQHLKLQGRQVGVQRQSNDIKIKGIIFDCGIVVAGPEVCLCGETKDEALWMSLCLLSMGWGLGTGGHRLMVALSGVGKQGAVPGPASKGGMNELSFVILEVLLVNSPTDVPAL